MTDPSLPPTLTACAWRKGQIAPEVADRAGQVWGQGSDTFRDPGPRERALRTVCKRTQVTHRWCRGGKLHQSRHHSPCLPLRNRDRHDGRQTPVRAPAPAHGAR